MNEYRITLRKLADDYGHKTVDDFLIKECQDSVVPACCSEGCEVEPDGYCEHNCPSPLVVAGLI